MKESLKTFGICNNKLKRWLIQNAFRSTINKWYLITLKVCVRQRTLLNKERCNLDIEGEKSFTNSALDIGIMSTVEEEVKKLYNKKTNNTINDWYTYLHR